VRILLDACVWAGARDALRDAGHEVECVADWRADPGDEQVLAHAAKHRQVLVTLDKDFGELAIVREQPHAGIIRLANFRAAAQGPACVQVVGQYGSELAAGAVVTAEPGRTFAFVLRVDAGAIVPAPSSP
jgi:predicted nuclease of predicted toxin-antitoxin system